MNNSTSYNGWTNRETWLTSLWLNNDQANYELLTNALRLNVPSYRKADKLHYLVEEQMYDLELEASLWSDLLSTALAEVNWLEVIVRWTHYARQYCLQ